MLEDTEKYDNTNICDFVHNPNKEFKYNATVVICSSINIGIRFSKIRIILNNFFIGGIEGLVR